MLAVRREDRAVVWFTLGSRSPEYGRVYTGRLGIRCLQAGSRMGGDASMVVGGEDNAPQNEKSCGPDVWAFWPGRAPRPRLPDDDWPFRGP